MNSPAFFVMNGARNAAAVDWGTNDSMLTRSLCLLVSLGAVSSAAAVELAPHKAVYDLSLAAETQDTPNVEGRIAIDMTVRDCQAYDFDYRFVARFGESAETTLTDQRITASESLDGRTYEFEAFTFVDGVEQGRVEGVARTASEETRVEMQEPVERDFAIRAALFPLGHTRQLIESAQAGLRIVETPLYDGDAEGENLLTTTSIILPLPEDAARPEGVEGLKGWRIDESYFTSESDADGLPTFHTRYTLFENGVSDDLYMDFGDYALRGELTELTVHEETACS